MKQFMAKHDLKPHVFVCDSEYKSCGTCGLEQPLSSFTISKDRWDGLSSVCKLCQSMSRKRNHKNLLDKQNPITCLYCSTVFYKSRAKIKYSNTHNKRHSKFCSHKCYRNSQQSTFQCSGCKKTVSICEYKAKARKYCTFKCYDLHRPQCFVSKLELLIQEQLSILYPSLDFHFNRRDTINSELDIYIPSLKLGFELNGIYHYEPIYGPEVLARTQNNDKRKFQACLERGVELCVIDSSKNQRITHKTAKPYLDIITNIINQKLT